MRGVAGWEKRRTDQFQYIKIQPNTIDLSTRLWGINPSNSVFIPQSLVLGCIVLGWILILNNIEIGLLVCFFGPLENFDSIPDFYKEANLFVFLIQAFHAMLNGLLSRRGTTCSHKSTVMHSWLFCSLVGWDEPRRSQQNIWLDWHQQIRVKWTTKLNLQFIIYWIIIMKPRGKSLPSSVTSEHH